MGRTPIYASRDEARTAQKERYQEKRRLALEEKYKKMGITEFYEGVTPGTLAYKILNDVKMGIKESKSGYAKKYHTTDKRVASALTRLRRKGHFVHPIGTIYGGEDTAKPGILTDITEHKSDYIEANNNLNKFRLNPAIERSYHMLEVFVLKNPAQYKFGLEAAEMLRHKALEAKKKFEANVKSNS